MRKERGLRANYHAWPPDDEGAQLRFAFETEIKRLEAA